MTQIEWKQIKKEEYNNYKNRLELEKKIVIMVTEAIISELKGIRQDLRGENNDHTDSDNRK